MTRLWITFSVQNLPGFYRKGLREKRLTLFGTSHAIFKSCWHDVMKDSGYLIEDAMLFHFAYGHPNASHEALLLGTERVVSNVYLILFSEQLWNKQLSHPDYAR